MKPLICPQCGGKITNYTAQQNFAVCGYCATRFVVEQSKPSPPKPADSTPNVKILSIVIAAGCLILAGIFTITILPRRQTEPLPTFAGYSRPSATPIPTPTPAPAPTPNPNLLEFGGKGTGNGLFQDADALAVDRQGRIYVADETLRVQQFDERGEFIKLWQIPSATGFYKRARTIDKIAVDERDRIFVLVGGIVFIYENASSEPSKIIHFAPNPIQDFAFRSDGGKLYLINEGDAENLYQITDTGKTVRRTSNFHTETADASMSPRSTGLAAIRFAVDGAGNIYSVYAFGDLGSYQLSYNSEDLMIFRFTPEMKYVNKFVQTMNSCGIEVDNQSRLYLSDNDSIIIYSNTGETVSTVYAGRSIDAFALDKQNSIYILTDDKVIKRPAIQ